LIFVKNVFRRDPELEIFLDEIKNQITITFFDDVIELRKEMKKSIVRCVSRRFQKNKDNSIYLDPSKEVQDQGKMEPVKEAKKIPLATGQIIDFEIPSIVKTGTENRVSVMVMGKGNYFFLTLSIIDTDKKQNWYAVNESVNLTLNAGKMKLDDQEYQKSWKFAIFGNAKVGIYTAFLGFYEDTFDLPSMNRRLIDYEIKNFEVVSESEQSAP
jgi:hypothetical protein